VAPVLARYGLDRQSGGAARQADDAVRTGVPGDEEVGFPEGSLPTRGLPGARPKGELPPAPAPEHAVSEQLTLL
jgi:hypothetical protein